MKIIIDTNLLIDFMRQKKSSKENLLYPQIVRYAKIEGHQLILPAVSVFELFAGDEMNHSSIQEKTENLLKDLLILDLNKETAQMAAYLFRKYKKTIGVVDYIMAATAIVLKGELATLNSKHFQPIKNLQIFALSILKKYEAK